MLDRRGWLPLSLLMLPLLLLLVPGGGLAKPARGPTGGGWGSPDFFEQHAERLGLDAAMLAEIRAIAKRSERRGEELREKIRAGRAGMQALLDQASPDDGVVMKQAEVIGALELEEKKNILGTLLATRALLTSEQREELFRIREELTVVRQRRRRPLRACRNEVAALCADAPVGEAEACLTGHQAELSEACRSALARPRRDAAHAGPPKPPSPNAP